MTPESLYFPPHDWVPNHPRLPVLLYRDVPDAAMRERIASLPFPDTDPVTGSEPPLTRFWPRG